MTLGSAVPGLGLSYFAAMASGFCMILVAIADSPGGEVHFVGKTIPFPMGNSVLLGPLVITRDSYFVLGCDGTTKKDGYITRGLQVLVNVKISGCEIKTYKELG